MPMIRRRTKLPIFQLIAIAMVFGVVTTNIHSQSFRFLATGDLPYNAEQDVKYRQLLKQSEKEDFDFLLHVGDFKWGQAPCDDQSFEAIRDLFQAYPKTVLFTPGDNDWTDCHRAGQDPIEQLARLRKLFFEDRQVLRLHQLGAQHQSQNTDYAEYIENYRFVKAGVHFIVVHIVGSLNNSPQAAEGVEIGSLVEFQERSRANLAFLLESFEKARSDNAEGVALIIHANPDFENGRKPGYAEFQSVLSDFLNNYSKPVLCIHGDTHYFRIDKPLKNAKGIPYMHFTRLELFGSPNVAGVDVSINPKDPLVFSYRPYYLQDPSQ
jgi:hypothetical protein